MPQLFSVQKIVSLKKVIQEHEGIYLYPYVDTSGKITVGQGLNINDDSQMVEWWYRNPETGEMRLLDKQNSADKKLFENELKKLDKYKKGNDKRAEFFESVTNLRITESHAHQLYLNRVNQAINGVKDLIKTHNENRSKKIADFEQLPEPLQIVLVDMVYNLGYSGFHWKLQITKDENGNEVKNGYPRFWKALEDHNLDAMIEQSKRNVTVVENNQKKLKPLKKRNENTKATLEKLRDYWQNNLQ